MFQRKQLNANGNAYSNAKKSHQKDQGILYLNSRTFVRTYLKIKRYVSFASGKPYIANQSGMPTTTTTKIIH